MGLFSKKISDLFSKLDYKLIVFTLFIVVAIILSTYFFSGLTNEKKIVQTDIFSLIPINETKAILQINEFENFLLSYNKLHTITSFSDSCHPEWLIALNNIIFPLSKKTGTAFISGLNPVYVSFHRDGEVYYANFQQHKTNLWEKQLKETIFPDFPPVIQKYKGFDIRHYAMSNSHFFSCILIDGIFIGSYQFNTLKQVIDACAEDGTGNKDTTINLLIRHEGKKTVANLFYYSDAIENIFVENVAENQQTGQFSGWSNADITFVRNEVWLSGYFKQNDSINTTIRNYQPVSLSFPEELQPPQTLFVKGVSTKKTAEKEGSALFDTVNDGLYTIYLNDSTTESVFKMFCLKLKDQAVFENELKLFLSTNYACCFQIKPLSIDMDVFNSFVLRNGNMLNEIIGYPFFSSDKTYYLSFYKGFMFVSDKELNLSLYLKLLLSPNWTKRPLFKESKENFNNAFMQGYVKQIVEAKDSTLYFSKGVTSFLPPFLQWKFEIQSTKEDNLFLFQLILANND